MTMGGFLGGYQFQRSAQNAMDAMDRAARDVSNRREREVSSSVEVLEDRLEKLSLVSLAMWSLIQEKTGLTEQDLMDRVKAIDLADGIEDGKVTQTVSKCVKCGRTMSPRHRKCLYCGAAELRTSAFDDVTG
jgi:ribosomal protein S27AE